MLLNELVSKINEPMKAYYNNKAAIAMSHNCVNRDRTKHVEVIETSLKKRYKIGQSV